ncbi:2'-5' RNA ligase family protein [Bosea sp. SSUT16]|uniref:2'-5' RNA ligase family protein n=1 Tax=Bosea spartocytisi TaxID=2773451 RepID=A0A927E4L6_9HYPH|nr:2'-5' RNA ligase family protein [Bosea spartocytisi]MBD3844298.1 2'-5' RNA ligase family protein [Bosea spartocytisi]MCT4470596.1 2'-5' RNA ligase family protein [Bosea spartocytisi]
MGFAISLRSDHPSADSVRALWNDVQRFEDHPSMALLGYPPHVTLAIYDDETVREAEVRDALDQASKNLRPVTLTFDAICSFDGPPMVLWASPRFSAVLRDIHEAIHAAIHPASCRPHYRPGTWKPHCTLGTRVRDDRRDAALAFAREASSVFDVIFDALDCIYFPPIAPFELRKLL